MSTIDFDKFDLDGLSLEDVEPGKAEKPEPSEKAETAKAIDAPENAVRPEPDPVQPVQVEEIAPAPAEDVELVVQEEHTENAEDQMTCPKCELQQSKAEQCSACGVYVEKALAQIGQSKIQITATKF